MALRDVIFSENNLLTKISKPVTEFNLKLWELLDDMKDTMCKNNGVGLAAPQVGYLRRVVVIEVNNMFLELVNPEIISESGKQCEVEGCLSVKNIQGYVNRPAEITVKACDRYGNDYIITGTGYLAIALSHEIDHLNGILFTSKMVKIYIPEKDKENEEKSKI